VAGPGQAVVKVAGAALNPVEAAMLNPVEAAIRAGFVRQVFPVGSLS